MILPSAVWGANAPSRRLTIACIGMGGMGMYHLQGLMAEPRCRVVAVCDVDAKRMEAARAVAKLGEADATQDFRQLIERPDVDIINIATPDHWHTPMALMAMRAGKAVYLQKPVSVYIEEGRLLANEAKRLGTVLQVGSQQRSHAGFRRAAEAVRWGRIGTLRRCEVGLEKAYYPAPGLQQPELPPPTLDYDLWLGPARWKPFSYERLLHFRGFFDYTGGYFADWGAHHFDIIQWAMDMDHSGPTHAEGTGKFWPDGIFDVPHEFDVTYRYGNGVEVRASTELENGIRFIGSEGWVFISRERMEASRPSILADGPGPGEDPLPDSRDHTANLLEAVWAGRDPIVTAEVGHRSATMCHIGNLAMRLRRPLQWDPVREEFVGDDEANRMRRAIYREPWRVG